jgi:hypothetical protein
MKKQPAFVAPCLVATVFHPEFMLLVADRRKDVHTYMMLGGLSALVINLPFFFIFFGMLIDGGAGEPFVLLMAFFSLFHAIFYGIRAAIIAVTRTLRRPSDLKTYFWSAGDYALLTLALVQFLLLVLLAITCILGKSKGQACLIDFEPGSGGVFDDFNRTEGMYRDECEPVMPRDQTQSMLGYFLWIIFL